VSRPIGPTTPTLGRIVHIADEHRGAVTAIVTAVLDLQTIKATVFPPDGQPFPITAEHVEPAPGLPNPPAGTWHWPPIR
jgi:hypothetical protein